MNFAPDHLFVLIRTNFSADQMRRFAFLALASCVLTACKPAAPTTAQNQTPGEPSLQTPGDARRQPSTAELTNFIRSNLPPVLKLVELKNDPPAPPPNIASGSNVWFYNVRLTFAPIEDELSAPSAPVAASFQAIVDELNGLIAWSQAYAQSPYASRHPGFIVEPPAPASPQLLALRHPKDRPLAPIYGKMMAEWQVDHWQFSMVDMNLPEDDGRFRSTFTGPILLQGGPDAERFMTAAKAAIAQAKPKKETIEAAYKEDLRKATQPSTLYKGQITMRKQSMAAEWQFIASPGGDSNLVRFELRLPASGYVFTGSAKLAAGIPNMPQPPDRTDDPIMHMVEPPSQGDLKVTLEQVNPHKLNLADEPANTLFYSRNDVKNIELTLRDGQLSGNLWGIITPGFMLSAQRQNP